MADRYQLSPGQAERTAARTMRYEGFVPRVYFDTHDPPIPTLASGQSLTDLKRRPWDNLTEILTNNGVDPAARVPSGTYQGQPVDVAMKIAFRSGDFSGIEGWRAGAFCFA